MFAKVYVKLEGCIILDTFFLADFIGTQPRPMEIPDFSWQVWSEDPGSEFSKEIQSGRNIQLKDLLHKLP